MNRWYLILIFSGFLGAFKMPKSSLEVVRQDISNQLAKAEKEKNGLLIDKYTKDLAELAKKIKNFELQWLQYRKNMLSLKTPDATVKTEIAEIDSLLKAHGE